MRLGIIREAEVTFFSGGVDIFSRGTFSRRVENFFSKTHQIAPFFKKFSGEHAPETP